MTPNLLAFGISTLSGRFIAINMHFRQDWEIFSIFNFDSGTLSSNLNEEQKTAVINIVEAKNVPLPYLLFGPAGRILYKTQENVSFNMILNT